MTRGNGSCVVASVVLTVSPTTACVGDRVTGADVIPGSASFRASLMGLLKPFQGFRGTLRRWHFEKTLRKTLRRQSPRGESDNIDGPCPPCPRPRRLRHLI